jgi:hypothetical protein
MSFLQHPKKWADTVTGMPLPEAIPIQIQGNTHFLFFNLILQFKYETFLFVISQMTYEKKSVKTISY